MRPYEASLMSEPGEGLARGLARVWRVPGKGLAMTWPGPGQGPGKDLAKGLARAEASETSQIINH